MAASGGAQRVVSVDSFKTYLAWGQDNFGLNKLKEGDYIFERSDSFDYLKKSRDQFDIIFLDPPTFSNSKSRHSDFDIQRDHPDLIRLSLKRLKPGGLLIFSNNYNRFEMDAEILQDFAVEEVTGWTRSEDFIRNKFGHRCWFIRQEKTS